MEKDFYTDDFEQLLKDTTDDFRMYPSRKVWHSIYNDLHPARKWPSFAVCLLLITSILFVGVHNNNSINADVDNLFLSTLAAPEPQLNEKDGANPSGIKGEIIPGTKEGNQAPGNLNRPLTQFVYAPSIGIGGLPVSVIGEQVQPAGIAGQTLILPADILRLSQEAKMQISSASPTADQTVIAETDPSIKANTTQATLDELVISSLAPVVNTVDDQLNQVTKDDATSQLKTTLSSFNTPAKTEDKVFMEDFVLHNKRKGNRFVARLSTLVYLTPSVGYRTLNKNNNLEPVNALLVRSSATSADADDAISQQASINLESGASAIMDLTRKLRLKAGIQFNLTSYISYAERLSHPILTNVLLNDVNTGNTMLVPFSTTYGNGTGENIIHLNNKTAQFSLPIGADYQLAGNNKLKWYIGATIQPTYVAGGTAYLISSDYKNYVDVPSMLRTWNVNAGFESFVSYKTSSGSVINIGPQFRYQLLSTYSNQYAYDEHLYNIGIKVGITRKF